LNHIYAQVIDDVQSRTIVAASTTEKSLGAKTGGNIEAAKLIGQTIAERALAAGVERVVFDRGGYLYHGRVKALTDAARAAGLNKDEVREAEAAEAAEPEASEAEPAKPEGKQKSPKAKAKKEAAPKEAKPAAASPEPKPARLKQADDGDVDNGQDAAKAKEE
jgi:large subunit ribosomal protein L18